MQSVTVTSFFTFDFCSQVFKFEPNFISNTAFLFISFSSSSFFNFLIDLKLGGVRGVVVSFGWFLLLGGGGLRKVCLFVPLGGEGRWGWDTSRLNLSSIELDTFLFRVASGGMVEGGGGGWSCWLILGGGIFMGGGGGWLHESGSGSGWLSALDLGLGLTELKLFLSDILSPKVGSIGGFLGSAKLTLFPTDSSRLKKSIIFFTEFLVLDLAISLFAELTLFSTPL